MNIVAAVTAAIESGDDSSWSARIRGGCAHAYHIASTAPDGRDHLNYRGIAAFGRSQRMGLLLNDAGRGSMRPELIALPFSESERRVGPRKGPEHRRDLWNRVPALGQACVVLD
jgi:hypothetical protein